MRHLRASLLTVAALAALAAVPGPGSRARGAQQADTPRQIIEITAERFTFTPSEIKVKAGTMLEIRLRSDDTAHGFRIVGTDVDLELPKRGRGVATAMFTPKAGRYTFECSRLCGAGHEFMRGVIVASE
ncbi:MAG TPA: cupredoxin domain-containing protein [Vicinamibacterales bacterium]|nr:cupredoxin domain-containing protein [Vicinamibacterales bacterium]